MTNAASYILSMVLDGFCFGLALGPFQVENDEGCQFSGAFRVGHSRVFWMD